MAKCAKCGSETGLHSKGIPVCFKCAGLGIRSGRASNEIRVILSDKLVTATKRNSEAIRKFEEVTDQFLSGSHNPDHERIINNASTAVSMAREEMASARNRLNDFLQRGIVPDDLKQCIGS
jgi:hypothetical protein